MNLSEINWPVFRLGERQPIVDGDYVYYINESINTDTNITSTRVKFIDDRSLPGDVLGIRRLAMKKAGAPMFIITKAVYYLGDLIKLSKSTTWFIDNSGRVFQYKKEKRVKLTCHKVSKILPIKGMGAVVELEGIPTRFKTLYSPNSDQAYAGVISIGLSKILYGFYSHQFKSTYRLV